MIKNTQKSNKILLFFRRIILSLVTIFCVLNSLTNPVWAVSYNNRSLLDNDFSGQDMRGDSFDHANLRGSDFSNANLQGVRFFSANLESANFSGADLRQRI